jgi:hypothetical protein
VRLADHPAIVGLDRERDGALSRDHRVVPLAPQALDAGQAGERQGRDDEQAALQALGRRGLERRARAAQVALSQQ